MFSAVLQDLNICQAGEKTPDVCNSNNERRFVMTGPGMCSRRSEIGTEWCHRRFLPHLEWNNAGALQNGWTVNRPLLGWKEPSSKGFSRGRVLESSLTMVCSQASKDRASGNFSKNLETITWLLPYHLLLSLTMEHGAWCSEQRPLRISNFSEITVALRSLTQTNIHACTHAGMHWDGDGVGCSDFSLPTHPMTHSHLGPTRLWPLHHWSSLHLCSPQRLV